MYSRIGNLKKIYIFFSLLVAVILFRTNKYINKELKKKLDGSEWFSPAFSAVVCSQALPYVALLIAMLFFIYAVIGMQVCIQIVDLFFFFLVMSRPALSAAALEFYRSKCLFFFVSGVWKGGHGGRHTYQQKQQLPDLPSGCAASLQVCSGCGLFAGCVCVCVCA